MTLTRALIALMLLLQPLLLLADDGRVNGSRGLKGGFARNSSGGFSADFNGGLRVEVDADGRVGSIWGGDPARRVKDKDGKITWVGDKNSGAVLRLVYNQAGQLVALRDKTSIQIRVSYGTDKKIESVRFPDGSSLKF